MTHAPERVRREDPRRTPPLPAGRAGIPGHRGSAGRRTLLRLLLVTFFGLAIAALTPGVASAAGEQLTGTLRASGGGPVEGVEVTVATPDGTEIDATETGEDGKWVVPVPGPGQYVVTIDADALPEGVSLTGPDTKTVTVQPGFSQAVSFPLEDGSRDDGGPIRSVQLLVDGIRFGLLIAICAIGLSLIFGTTGLTNFAHGELVTIGAVVAWFVNVSGGVDIIAATVVAVIVGGAVGALHELALWRPLRRRGTGLIAALVVSIGLSLVLRYFLQIVFEGGSRSYRGIAGGQANDFGAFRLTDADLTSIVVSLVVLVLVALMLQRTKIGKAMRAVADNRDLAAASGINVNQVILIVWVMGGALAALGGVLLGISDDVQWDMGFRLLLLMFAGVTLGGLGTAYGALVGSLVVGIFVQMSTLVVDADLKYVVGLLVLIVVLVVRPQGILGSRVRIG